MRRVVSVVLSALASLALAAPAGATGFTLGLRGGSSIPDLRDNGGNELSAGWSTRVAPYVGLWADYALSPSWSIQADFDYSPQGGRKDGLQAFPPSPAIVQAMSLDPSAYLYGRFRNESRLTYVEVPVLAMYHFGDARAWAVGLGPYVGLLLSAKQVTSGSSEFYLDKAGTQALPIGAQSFDATNDIKDSIHPFNWGLQAGASATRPVAGGEVSLDLRGSYGLSNIQEYAADGKNSTGNLVIALGYGRHFGGAR